MVFKILMIILYNRNMHELQQLWKKKKKKEEDREEYRVMPYAVSTKHIDIEYYEQEHLVLQLMLFPLVKIGLLPERRR